MADYKRPADSFRFQFGGVCLRDTPDAMAPNKYASAINIRQVGSNSVQTRPGYNILFRGAGTTIRLGDFNAFKFNNQVFNSNASYAPANPQSVITDIQSYAAIETDTYPRFLARDSGGRIWLDTSGLLLTMNSGAGASMIPFRPSASPQSWMYVADGAFYEKFSAPNYANQVTFQKVGIAEPQTEVEAAPYTPLFTNLTGNNANWAASNNTILTNYTWVADTSGVVIADPVNSSRKSVAVAGNGNYFVGMLLTFNNSVTVPVLDVLQQVPSANASQVSILGIRYSNNSTGMCRITCNYPTVDEVTGLVGQFAQLRRGALVSLGGNETVMVLSALAQTGPFDGTTCSFACSTNNTHSPGESIVGVPAVVVDGAAGANQSISALSVAGTCVAGNQTLTCANFAPAFPFAYEYQSGLSYQVQWFGIPPFQFPVITQTGNSVLPSEDDYVNVLLQVFGAANLTSLQIVFSSNANLPGVSWSYTVPALNFSSGGFAAFTQIQFPISALVQTAGNNVTGAQSLLNANQCQLTFSLSGNSEIALGGFWIGGGSSPDVGNNGAPYQYQAVPRNSATGTQGNPSPTMRYGVSPRRQQVALSLPSAAYDPQIDTWDIYRYGGSITSYRYIGSAQAGNNATFLDNVFDDTAAAGNPLPTENFEPWPSIDVPFYAPSNNVTIQSTYITVAGNSWPATIRNWLPGTVILLGGQAGYTLRSRPQLGNTGFTFEIEEGATSPIGSASFSIAEPNVANAPVPFMWGPDANGYVFAVGDLLRPGTIYWSTPNNLDTTADTSNLELCPPSEPLLNGSVINGLSFTASSDRWWAMYPAFAGTSPFAPQAVTVGRGLAAPRGICTDGQTIYFWAKDCIAAHQGSGFKDLTSLDLFGLFPREGIPGKNVQRYNATWYAPDYSHAASFRLAYRNGYLYATYQDSTATARCFVMDTKTGGWEQDVYYDPVTCVCAPPQPSGSTQSSTLTLYPGEVMGTSDGLVLQQNANAADNGHPISASVQTFEWNGGDARATKDWGDLYLDCIPAGSNGISATAMVNAAPLASANNIAQSYSREFLQLSVGGQTEQLFLGLYLSWTDAANQTIPTTLYLWQPSFLERPELTQDRCTDWEDFGQASYVRGFLILADTYSQQKQIGLRSADDLSMRGQTIFMSNEQELAYDFPKPFVSHRMRCEPQDLVPWQFFRITWIRDKWPELTALHSPWITLNGGKAAYLRAFTVSLDTNGTTGISPSQFNTGQFNTFPFNPVTTPPITLTLISSDGGSATVGPVSTPASEKTTVPFALTVPFICHSLQVIPSGPCRIWFDEIEWIYDAWPELISEATGWLKIYEDGGAAYLQGFIAPIESDGAVPQLSLLLENGTTVPLTALGTPVANIKSPIAYSLATPVVTHAVQIICSAPCRIWINEINWFAQRTPELATTWQTQSTAHGMMGYQHVQKIEAAWSSNASVTLEIVSFDGKSPQSITLPSTGGSYQKQLFYLTPNKGQLYGYRATSNNNFQIFLEDWRVHVKQWGSSGPYVPYRLLGGSYGDKAGI